MSTRKKPLSKADLHRAFSDGSGSNVKVILTVDELSALTGVAKSTLYQWIAQGRLDGTFRKRGKAILFWRDRVIAQLFNGPNWTNE